MIYQTPLIMKSRYAVFFSETNQHRRCPFIFQLLLANAHAIVALWLRHSSTVAGFRTSREPSTFRPLLNISMCGTCWRTLCSNLRWRMCMYGLHRRLVGTLPNPRIGDFSWAALVSSPGSVFGRPGSSDQVLCMVGAAKPVLDGGPPSLTRIASSGLLPVL